MTVEGFVFRRLLGQPAACFCIHSRVPSGREKPTPPQTDLTAASEISHIFDLTVILNARTPQVNLGRISQRFQA